jgi:alpha-acetolactate decarboxylase
MGTTLQKQRHIQNHDRRPSSAVFLQKTHSLGGHQRMQDTFQPLQSRPIPKHPTPQRPAIDGPDHDPVRHGDTRKGRLDGSDGLAAR